jgi:hypothetical protein
MIIHHVKGRFSAILIMRMVKTASLALAFSHIPQAYGFYVSTLTLAFYIWYFPSPLGRTKFNKSDYLQFVELLANGFFYYGLSFIIRDVHDVLWI